MKEYNQQNTCKTSMSTFDDIVFEIKNTEREVELNHTIYHSASIKAPESIRQQMMTEVISFMYTSKTTIIHSNAHVCAHARAHTHTHTHTHTHAHTHSLTHQRQKKKYQWADRQWDGKQIDSGMESRQWDGKQIDSGMESRQWDGKQIDSGMESR